MSNYKDLPKKAKYNDNKDIDENISLLLEDKRLKSVKKDNSGSPSARVSYNFEIVKGDYSKWQ
nr:hypothetical protein [Streptococcus downei]